MTLSDFRTGHPPVEHVGGATSTSAGYPPMTQTTFLTCRAHYPGGSYRCVSVSFPVRAAFPNYLVGRHPRRHFRGLLKLHSRYGLQDCSPAYGGLLSRGSSPASYPTKPLGSYHVLPTSTWVNPPFTGDLRRWGAQVGLGWVTFEVLRRTHGTLSKKIAVDPKVLADQRGHGLGVSLEIYPISDFDQ